MLNREAVGAVTLGLGFIAVVAVQVDHGGDVFVHLVVGPFAAADGVIGRVQLVILQHILVDVENVAVGVAHQVHIVDGGVELVAHQRGGVDEGLVPPFLVQVNGVDVVEIQSICAAQRHGIAGFQRGINRVVYVFVCQHSFGHFTVNIKVSFLDIGELYVQIALCLAGTLVKGVGDIFTGQIIVVNHMVGSIPELVLTVEDGKFVLLQIGNVVGIHFLGRSGRRVGGGVLADSGVRRRGGSAAGSGQQHGENQ